MNYSSDSRGKKEKNQHIQVFVRVRPPNASEKSGRSATVVEVPTNKEVVIKERPQDKHTKKFTFDQVFGAASKQIDVYDAVVKPLVAEVLAGYNCTVFAYGQTGTGKTFTMEGLNNDPAIHWQSDTQAGIIPRTLSHLFDELRVNDAQEYTVRVSFLELYNEELFDLLTPSDDASKIRLYEDASKKGSVIIHGLEEVTVHNKSEVYKILEKGSEKRQTAATLMNAHSSRSHTVFSITVHIKENTVEGEELLKTGKINLVDLAGSENVGRSGAVDRRAREAGNINQSLLTLGRVITALVERAPHIPYRESKLTRILQESLGGRTKTSIIATVSPSSLNIEETLSTLDYAHRAKNITNRPEINQKMSKKALLKEYTEEIERLRRDLSATRERNGVYLAQENYNEMQAQIVCQGKEIEEKINHIKAIEEAMNSTKKIFNELQEAFENEKRVLRKTEEQLEEKKIKLKTTRTKLEETMIDREVQKHLVEKHQSTEERLLSQAQTLLTVADTATADAAKLHDKIFRKKIIEAENVKIEKQFQNDISDQIKHIEEDMSEYIQNTIQFCLAQKNVFDSQTSEQCSNIDKTITHVSEELPTTISNITSKFAQSLDKSDEENNEWLKRELLNTNKFSEQQLSSLTTFFPNLAQEIRKIMDNKLSENLQLIQSDLTEKLSKLSEKSQDSVKMICDVFNKNHNILLSELMAMEKSNEENLNLEKEKFEERVAIIEEFDDVYNKMIDLMENQFAKSIKRAKLFNKKDSQKPVTDHLQSIGQFCFTIKDKSTQGLSDGTKFAHEKEEETQKVLKRIKLDADSALRENWTLADTTRNSCNNLVSKMETEVNEYVKNIDSYQTERQASGKELREQLERHKNSSASFVKDIKSTVSSAGSQHKEFMEAQKSDIMAICNGNKRKWDSESVSMNEWRTNMSTQLHATKQQVDKFLKEDLRRDQSTGTTPIRRDFSYPKNLASTSPHERIIQRFKESQLDAKKILGFDESLEEDTDTENSQLSLTSQGSNFLSVKEIENTPKTTPGTPKRNSSSARISAESQNEKNSQQIELPTEILINNKENEDEVPMSKKSTKRSDRLSQLTRKVLGSSN